MVEKTCEVCGRKIKTGRKYCWEHRKNNSPNDNRIYDEAISAFLNQSSFDVDLQREKFIEEHKKLIRQVEEKSPEFIEFVKNYSKKIKQEKEFIKSLVR